MTSASAASVSRSSTVKQGSGTSARSQETRHSGHKTHSKSQSSETHDGAIPQKFNTMFNDLAHMEQWVATTANSATSFSSSPDDGVLGFPEIPLETDTYRIPSMTSGDLSSAISGPIQRGPTSGPQYALHGSHSTISSTMPQYSAGYDGMPLPEIPGCNGLVGTQNHARAQAYPSPQTDDCSYAFQDPLAISSGEWDPTDGVSGDWSGAVYPGVMPTSGAGLQPSSYPSDWTPTSFIESSVSSTCSQASMVAPLPDTPISPYMMGHPGSADFTFSMDAESGQFQALNLGDSVPNASQVAYFNEPFDAESTLKPCRPFQRTSLSTMASWPSAPMPSSAMMSPHGLADHSRALGSGEPLNAREHPYYSIGPKEDGLYHCPFGRDGDCQHKPEKLKCNYDKHLDSHLKPYRCKIAACSDSQFSSTACLLRHEREAHGMHGHGEKPHLCYFSECDRSYPGNGFPRRWNLFDHMKRVHDYSGSSSSSSGGSPPSLSTSERRASATLPIRNVKRKQASPVQAESMKRSRSNQMPASSNKPAPIKSSKSSSSGGAASGHSSSKKKSLQQSFEQQKAALQAQVDNLRPGDAQGFQQMTAHYQVLNTTAIDLQRHHAGEAASKMRAY